MQALNSLLYWLLDLVYKEMGAGLRIPRWAPEPYLLRVPGVEARMVAELRTLGRLLLVLARAPAAGGGGVLLEGAALLRAVREVETTATLLSTIGRAREVRGEVAEEDEVRGEVRGEVAAAAPLPPPPRVVARYAQLVASPGLELIELQSLQHEALAELLDLEVGFVAARHAAIAKAFAEWHRPELLFRYLDDNRADAKAAPLIRRWLRAIFGLSTESLRQIRREAHANVRHLSMLPRGVLLRWYAEACPGTSSMQVPLTPSHAQPHTRSLTRAASHTPGAPHGLRTPCINPAHLRGSHRLERGTPLERGSPGEGLPCAPRVSRCNPV